LGLYPNPPARLFNLARRLPLFTEEGQQLRLRVQRFEQINDFTWSVPPEESNSKNCNNLQGTRASGF